MPPIAIPASPDERELAEALQSLSDRSRSRPIAVALDTPPEAEHPGVDQLDVLAARVRAGEAIHVDGPLEGPVGLAHLAMINRLRSETGLPVRVIFS